MGGTSRWFDAACHVEAGDVTIAEPVIELKDSELSAIYQIADQVSGAGQRRTKRLVRAELVALIAASGAGVTAIRVTSYELDVLAPISAIAFVVALVCTDRKSTRLNSSHAN